MIKELPPYHASPVVRKDLIDKHPSVPLLLEELASKITHEDIIQLNYQVDVLHIDVAKVVKEFLREKDLL
ncbi:glycine betaine ABC transporter substrate-binding protein [Halalkalibacter flavus]|jgi:glycine betaine/choline ABC-type transport system substrate-binding protein|uniref:glycine betaine ABC transporter substrate-binding protein n=1 Tax=Halalkalibacter flavus TaxID=3090668 RepID=UPI002FC726D8